MKLNSSNKTFEPANEGVHDCVCVDVSPCKKVTNSFGEKIRFRIVFQSSQVRDDGKRFLLMKSYTPSLHKKSTLYKDLCSWRGRPLTQDDMDELGTTDKLADKIIGACAQVVVVHNQVEETTYANITAILKPRVKLALDSDYTRIINRPDFEPSEWLMDDGQQQKPTPTAPVAPVARPVPAFAAKSQIIPLAKPGAVQTHTQADWDAVNAELDMNANDLTNKDSCPF